MQSSNQPGKISVPFAESGQKQTIPVASQVGIEDGRASYTTGFPELTRTPLAAGGVPPFGTDMNGILFALSAIQQWQSAGGGFKYDAAFAASIGGYPRGAVLMQSSGYGYWRNDVENNISDPDSGGSGWVPLVSGAATGDTRNAKISVPSASSSATFTADEVVVKTSLGGLSFCLPSFSQSVNLAVTGAGGMDTGSAPVNGWVAVYAIYNPVTGARSLIARNATASAQPEIYGGGSMPAGFTASALVAVWGTNGSGQFLLGSMNGRRVVKQPVPIINTSSIQASYALLSISGAVPMNAKRAKLLISAINTNTGTVQTIDIASDVNGSGQQTLTSGVVLANNGNQCPGEIEINTPQTIFYRNVNSGGGTPTFNSYISGYEF